MELYSSNPTRENLHKVANDLLSEMTLKERIRILQGHALGVTAKNFITKGRFYNGEAYPAGGCKRLGIPPILFTDGPRGIVMRKSTCFPVSMLRGATFDDELEYRVGEVFAKEAKKHKDAPTIIEFMISTDELVLPMVKGGNPMSEMILK